MRKLKDNVYFVGTMNPNVRVFDVVMRTEYGTSYNAYIVKGDDKTVLIDTVHSHLEKPFLENIAEVVPLDKIDAIIVNHSEPDHSGTLVKLVDINPDVEVYGSAASMKNLKKIINRDFKANVVKQGDTYALGGGEVLEFIPNPNVHWPDTIFTYYPAKKVLFSCDFLGAHYCEPTVTDDFLTYEDAYWEGFKNYYDSIMSPFKSAVIAGLDKIDKLDIDLVANSHGPVLIHNIDKCKALYREWSKDNVKPNTAAIFYASAYGYTKNMAEIIADELTKNGIETKSFELIYSDKAEVLKAIDESAMLFFGSPTINRDAVPPLWEITSEISAIANKGKPALVFGSYGWSGEGVTNIQARANMLGLKVYPEPLKLVFKPSDEELERVREVVRDFISISI